MFFTADLRIPSKVIEGIFIFFYWISLLKLHNFQLKEIYYLNTNGILLS